MRGGGTLLDPVRELRNLFTCDPMSPIFAASTPLFRTHERYGIERMCITVSALRGVIKRLMSAVGEDPARFGAHSCRIGGASAALAANVPPQTIRAMGRWSSDVYEIYTRASVESVSLATQLIGSTPFNDLERGFHAEHFETLPQEVDFAASDDDERASEDEL